MMSMHEIAADVSRNWILYVSMPFVASAIGYSTKIVAIWMMFNPIEWFGLNTKIAGYKVFGWQGIIPRRAEFMAGVAVDTMTRDLISTKQIFDRLDSNRIAQELEKPMQAIVDKLTREVAMQYQPGLWGGAPEALRQLIIRRVQQKAPALVKQIMDEIKSNHDALFDLKHMVTSNLLKDVRLLNRIFSEVGHAEFRFIRNSGIYFGFIIGCVQAVTWALTHNAWVMPMFGGFTGWFTDWLALKMIFVPQTPKKYFGLITWQGLFQKRRLEVAGDYGKLIAAEIIKPDAILDSLLRGPHSAALHARIRQLVQQSVDESAGAARPLVKWAVGEAKYQDMKNAIADKVTASMPEAMRHMEHYAMGAMDIENTLVNAMRRLNEEQFEKLIRPAFQQDEWILITVGAVLGFLVGEMQVFIMLHAGAH
jgi:uncharacterized membrane protein YheB (UPF0754 family)